MELYKFKPILCLKSSVRTRALSGMFLTVLLIIIGLFPVSSDSVLKNIMSDLDGDGLKEEYLLINHSLMVKEEGRELWHSPSDWRIDNFALGDVDNDGINNLVFSLWKTGSFGAVKPFWKVGEDRDYKNHLFVYRLENKMLKEVWCSSDLDRPIASFTIQDVENDGLVEIMVKEGQYQKFMGKDYAIDIKDTQITVWQWDEWGFRIKD